MLYYLENLLQPKILLIIIAFILGIPLSMYGLSILQGKIVLKYVVQSENCKKQLIDDAVLNNSMSSKNNDLGSNTIDCFNSIDAGKSDMKFYKEDLSRWKREVNVAAQMHSI